MDITIFAKAGLFRRRRRNRTFRSTLERTSNCSESSDDDKRKLKPRRIVKLRPNPHRITLTKIPGVVDLVYESSGNFYHFNGSLCLDSENIFLSDAYEMIKQNLKKESLAVLIGNTLNSAPTDIGMVAKQCVVALTILRYSKVKIDLDDVNDMHYALDKHDLKDIYYYILYSVRTCFEQWIASDKKDFSAMEEILTYSKTLLFSSENCYIKGLVIYWIGRYYCELMPVFPGQQNVIALAVQQFDKARSIHMESSDVVARYDTIRCLLNIVQVKLGINSKCLHILLAKDSIFDSIDDKSALEHDHFPDETILQDVEQLLHKITHEINENFYEFSSWNTLETDLMVNSYVILLTETAYCWSYKGKHATGRNLVKKFLHKQLTVEKYSDHKDTCFRKWLKLNKEPNVEELHINLEAANDKVILQTVIHTSGESLEDLIFTPTTTENDSDQFN